VPELKSKPIVIASPIATAAPACQGPQPRLSQHHDVFELHRGRLARKHLLADRRGVKSRRRTHLGVRVRGPAVLCRSAHAPPTRHRPARDNVFRMFSKMAGQRLATTARRGRPRRDHARPAVRGDPDVAALSSLDGKKLCVFRLALPRRRPAGPDAAVPRTPSRRSPPLAAGNARLTHYRHRRHAQATPSPFWESWARHARRLTRSTRNSGRGRPAGPVGRTTVVPVAQRRAAR